jgi:hypothetical protein
VLRRWSSPLFCVGTKSGLDRKRSALLELLIFKAREIIVAQNAIVEVEVVVNCKKSVPVGVLAGTMQYI